MYNYMIVELSENDVKHAIVDQFYSNPLCFTPSNISSSPVLSWLYEFKLMIEVEHGYFVIDRRFSVLDGTKVIIGIED